MPTHQTPSAKVPASPVQHSASVPSQRERQTATSSGSLPSRNLRLDFGRIPIFPGGSPPAFFNAQAFSPAVAAQAVAPARPGSYPFGDQIAAETKGAIDPHRVPATIAPALPGLGVCHQGKVALRKDAGIDVARHELAHALGADERTADRAGRNASILESLGRRSPVDGWKIGFEFQTVKDPNPKVYELTYVEGQLPPDAQEQDNHGQHEQDDAHHFANRVPDPNEQDAFDPQFWDRHEHSELRRGPRRAWGHTHFMKGRGWDLEQDSCDIEIVTHPVDETAAGREELIKQMADVAKEMNFIQESARKPAFLVYDDPESCVMHNSRVNFAAHPQATIGTRFDAIADLYERLANQEPINADRPNVEAKWSDDDIGWSYTSQAFEDIPSRSGQLTVRAGLLRLRQALGNRANQEEYRALHGLLSIFVGYVQMGTQTQQGEVIHFKDVGPIKVRNDMHEAYQKLSKPEKDLYAQMLADGSMARIFGAPDMQTLNATRLFRRGRARLNDSDRVNPRIGHLLTTLPDHDVLGLDVDDPIHTINERNIHLGKMIGVKHIHDIGVSDTQQGQHAKLVREGLFLELRGLKRHVPWPEWATFALHVFDLAVEINGNAERRKHQAISRRYHQHRNANRLNVPPNLNFTKRNLFSDKLMNT